MGGGFFDKWAEAFSIHGRRLFQYMGGGCFDNRAEAFSIPCHQFISCHDATTRHRLDSTSGHHASPCRRRFQDREGPQNLKRGLHAIVLIFHQMSSCHPMPSIHLMSGGFFHTWAGPGSRVPGPGSWVPGELGGGLVGEWVSELVSEWVGEWVSGRLSG